MMKTKKCSKCIKTKQTTTTNKVLVGRGYGNLIYGKRITALEWVLKDEGSEDEG